MERFFTKGVLEFKLILHYSILITVIKDCMYYQPMLICECDRFSFDTKTFRDMHFSDLSIHFSIWKPPQVCFFLS